MNGGAVARFRAFQSFGVTSLWGELSCRIYEAEDLPGAMLLKSGVETLDGCIGAFPCRAWWRSSACLGPARRCSLVWKPEVFIDVEGSGRRKKLQSVCYGQLVHVYSEGVDPIRDNALPPEAVEELSHIGKTARLLVGVPFVARGGSVFVDDRGLVLVGRCPQ